MSPTSTPHEAVVAPTPRFTSIDVLKASGIIAVIWIHAFQEFGTTEPLIIRRLAFLTRFAVPAFFFASGFLQANGRPLSPHGFVTRRLGRLLVPYVGASLLALGFRHLVFSEQIGRQQAAVELGVGAAWGVYYFIPLLLGATIVAQGIFRFRSLAWPVFALFWGLGLLSEMAIVPLGDFFWRIRSPLLWWGYFFAGWAVAPHVSALERLSAPRRRRIGVAALAAAATVFLYFVLALPASWTPQAALLGYVTIYSIVGGLFMLALGSAAMPVVRWLSEATYPIYLYHYFIIAVAHRWLAPPLRNPAAFVLGVAGSIGLVYTARKVLGRHARLLIG
ncbi:MAG: acyltransferase [Candidatus Binatia bacterium]